MGAHSGSTDPSLNYARAMRASITPAIRRYRALDIEYAALKVVGRGLFLAVMLMVAFLFVFTRVTNVIDGANEVLIPTVTVNPDVDLGELAQGAFSRTSASVVSVIGALTFVVSAFLTARALRQGSRRALAGGDAAPRHAATWATIALALALAIGILATWLLTLATSIRQRAWSALLGTEMSVVTVNAGKVLAVAVSLLIVIGAVLLVVRATTGSLPARAVAAALLVGVVTVAMNFALLYTYVGALINPDVSAGIVLVFTLLLWVNICVRAYLGALCWVASDAPPLRAHTA